MKNSYFKALVTSAILLVAGVTVTNAQDAPFLKFGGNATKDTSNHDLSLWTKLTRTPWVIQVGPDVVDDNDTRLKEFSIRDSRNYFPIHCSAEKRIKEKWGFQIVLASETLNPHNFWADDYNVKYNFLTKSIRDKKMFDPYALVGLGHTYRDFPHGQHISDNGFNNAPNLNVGAGAHLWLFENAGIFVQGVAKWTLLEKTFHGSNYLQFSAGVAFKIGSDLVVSKVEETVVVPGNYHKSKEAEEAADYLRQILNK